MLALAPIARAARQDDLPAGAPPRQQVAIERYFGHVAAWYAAYDHRPASIALGYALIAPGGHTDCYGERH